MFACITGHRPDKLGGYASGNPTEKRVRAALAEGFKLFSVQHLITGMALGVDQWAAEACVALSIPFLAAVPCEGQELRWSEPQQTAYRVLLANAEEVTYVTRGPYEAWKMMARNAWMVDRADAVLAIWDGSDGGTANCVRYARYRNKQIMRWDPNEPRWERWK